MDLVRPKVGIGKSWSLGRDWRVELESSAHTDLCGSNLGKSVLYSVFIWKVMMVVPVWGVVGHRAQCQEC